MTRHLFSWIFMAHKRHSLSLVPVVLPSRTLSSCHFTNKNITDKPDKVERLLVGYFSQKNFRGPRTPHFVDTDLSNFSDNNWKTNLPKFLQILHLGSIKLVGDFHTCSRDIEGSRLRRANLPPALTTSRLPALPLIVRKLHPMEGQAGVLKDLTPAFH